MPYYRNDLARDRTILANERTLLSYARTAIMLAVSGVTLLKVFGDDRILFALGILLLPAALGVALIGYLHFREMGRKLTSNSPPRGETKPPAPPEAN